MGLLQLKASEMSVDCRCSKPVDIFEGWSGLVEESMRRL